MQANDATSNRVYEHGEEKGSLPTNFGVQEAVIRCFQQLGVNQVLHQRGGMHLSDRPLT